MEYGTVKSIRLASDGLIKLAENKNFTASLVELVDDYNIIMTLTSIPEFSDSEKIALGELLIGAELSRSKIYGLYLDVYDLEESLLDEESKDQLAEKLKGLSVAQIVKIKNLINK